MNTLSEPRTLTKTHEICAFEARVVSIVFNESATLSVVLYGKDDLVVGCEVMMITGEDYKKWGTDDDYINQYVIANLDKIIR